MSRFTALTHSFNRTGMLSHKRVSAVIAVLDNTRTRFLLLMSVIVMGVLYIWLVNSTASAGFYLSDLEDHVIGLEEHYKKLQVEHASLQSLEHVQKMSEQSGLVATGVAEYVSGTSVAFVDSE
jgi:hypothetical protein